MINSLTRPVQSRPTRMRPAIFTTALLLSLAAGFAHAQGVGQGVMVQDQALIKAIGSANGNTVNGSLQNISNQLGGSTGANSSDSVNQHLKNIDTLGSAPATLSTVAAPAAAVNPDNMTMTAQGSGATDPCTAVAQQQRPQCENINSAKLARFNYMKAMYDSTIKLQQTLTSLQNARQGIGSEDYGKLQDNSNQLLAVIAQLQIDRQQMESVNHAYESYIEDQQTQQTQAAKAATAPDSAGGDLISSTASSIIGGAILQTALSVESSGNSDHQLSIEQ